MAGHYAIAISAVLLTAISQVLLKVGAMRGAASASALRLYLNRHSLLGYVLLFLATLLSLHAYRYIPLKAAVFLTPSGFILVLLLSYLLLRESFSRRQAAGSAIILTGIIVFNL